MTPELLLEVFRISWAKENAKKKRQKRLLEGGGIGRTENALRGRGDDDDDDDDDDDRGEDSDAEEMIITDEALIAANAVMNSFLKEVVHRAAAAAEEDGDSSVTGVHLERILPQLLLDFTS
jgi:centromere protein X